MNGGKAGIHTDTGERQAFFEVEDPEASDSWGRAGSFEGYHRNGLKSVVVRYKYGRVVGSYEEFGENGLQKQQAFFDEYGHMTGLFKEWHETGRVKTQGNYSAKNADKKIGKWSTFNSTGKLMSIADFGTAEN